MSETWLDTHSSRVVILPTLAEIIPTSSRIWSAVISVVMAALSKKDLWSSRKVVRKSSIFLSTWVPVFFKIRFPENRMFTLATEIGKDYVQNCASFAYDWIKSQQLQTCCNMSVRISACLGTRSIVLKVSSWFAKSKASCTATSKVRMLSSR
jgi:hypothetical protein